MPQKPTMPSPYMETVDASEEITFSCAIDSRDTITGYKINIKEIEKDESSAPSEDNSERIVIPPIYIDSVTLEDFKEHKLSFYKNNSDDVMYTMIMQPTVNQSISFPYTDKSINRGRDFVVGDTTILRDNIEKIIYLNYVDKMTISNYYFKNFKNVKEIQFLGTVPQSIGAYAFSGCGSIQELYFPDAFNTTKFYKNAFYNMSGLKKITLPHPIENLPDIEEFVFKTANIEDGKSTTAIPEAFFEKKSKLTKISFLEGVTDIGDKAFSGCSNLKEVVGLSKVKVIGVAAFKGCLNLKNIHTSSQKIEEVGDSAFADSGIEKFIITDGMKTLKWSAFNGCSSLNHIEILTQNNFTDSSSFKNMKEVDSSVNLYADFSKMTNSIISVINNLRSYRKEVSLFDLSEANKQYLVQIQGGKGDFLMHKIDANSLINDREYTWSVELTDNLGNTITSPNYYFKTYSNPKVNIEKIYEMSENEIPKPIEDGNGNIQSFKVNYTIANEKPLIIDSKAKEANETVLLDGEDDVENENYNVLSVETYVDEDNFIKARVTEAAVFQETDYEAYSKVGYFEIHRLPATVRENTQLEYRIQVKIPIEQIETDEEGNEQTYLIEKTFYVTALESSYSDYEAGVTYSDPIPFYIITIEDENGEEVTNKLGNALVPGQTYDIFYDTVFSPKYEYKINYWYETDMVGYKHTFTAEYKMNDETADFIPIKKYRWTLYEVDGGKERLVGDSGDIYSSYISYTYSMFLPNKNYVIRLEVENDEGVIAETEYAFKTAERELNEFEKNPEISTDKRKNAVLLRLYDAGIFYTIVRTDVERGTYKLIAEDIRGAQTVCDHTAASNTRYVYTVYGRNDTEGSIAVYTFGEIKPEWCMVSIIGFTGSYADTNPVVINEDDVWVFGLNVNKIDYTQNMAKKPSQAFSSRYPHIHTGKTNYGTFSISALMGDIIGCDYIKDTTVRTEKFQDFLASNMAKLVVDTKGRVSVCDATSSSNSYENGYLEQPTTFNISLTEIAPSDRVSLISTKEGE